MPENWKLEDKPTANNSFAKLRKKCKPDNLFSQVICTLAENKQLRNSQLRQSCETLAVSLAERRKISLKKGKLKKRILLISVFLIVWSMIFESPFQKGGVDKILHYVIFSLFVIISIVYLSTIESLIIAEKTIYSLLISFFSLFASLLITERLLEKIYGFDYEIKLSNIIANLIFYLLANGFIILTILSIRKLKT